MVRSNTASPGIRQTVFQLGRVLLFPFSKLRTQTQNLLGLVTACATTPRLLSFVFLQPSLRLSVTLSRCMRCQLCCGGVGGEEESTAISGQKF